MEQKENVYLISNPFLLILRANDYFTNQIHATDDYQRNMIEQDINAMLSRQEQRTYNNIYISELSPIHLDDRINFKLKYGIDIEDPIEKDNFSYLAPATVYQGLKPRNIRIGQYAILGNDVRLNKNNVVVTHDYINESPVTR